MKFADLINNKIEQSSSLIVAGIDPVFETFPEFIRKEAENKSSGSLEVASYAIKDFYFSCFEEISNLVAASKPNIAFFEQYGLPGLNAFSDVIKELKKFGLPIIADIKRGDIGSTAAAYSKAYLAKEAFDVDSITINPYLGFDTLEIFLKDAIMYDKGIFVLVKTSNPGSGDIQNLKTDDESTVSERVAKWLAKKSAALTGDCQFSGVGAVVGATYPSEAIALRKLMPNNLFLIPGMGAQGGTANEALAGAAHINGKKTAALINLSRGIFSGIPATINEHKSLRSFIKERVIEFNQQINQERNKA